MLEVYGLPGCDSTKKILKRLKAEHIPFLFHHLKVHPLEETTLKTWMQKLGIEILLNRQSTTWRSISESEKIKANTPDSAIQLLLQYPTLIKRPLLVKGEQCFAGTKEPGISEFLNH